MIYKMAMLGNKISLPASYDVLMFYIWRDISFSLHFEAIVFYQKLVSTKRAT